MNPMPLVMFIFLVGLVAILLVQAMHEAALNAVLRIGGVKTRARIAGRRRTHSGKYSKYYISYAYEPSEDYYNRILIERAVSSGLYYALRNGRQEITIRYLPKKPGISRIFEPTGWLGLAVALAVIGALFFGLSASGVRVNFSRMILPSNFGTITGLVIIGLVVAFTGFVLWYSQYLMPQTPNNVAPKAKREEKPKGLPAYEIPFDLPLDVPAKPKASARKAKGFTSLDSDEDEHPLY